MSSKHNPIIGITLGDINGVGPEVIIKALNDVRMLDSATPVIYGSAKTISYYRKNLKLEDFNFHQVRAEHQFEKKKVNVVNCWEQAVEINPGKVTQEGGSCARLALKQGTADLTDGFIDAIVTGPIDKANIQSEDFNFPGHTEYFTNACKAERHLMFMISETMRVGVATGHVPLKDVPSLITKERITETLNVMKESLIKDFALNKPRIAVLGLNPHAGEAGLLGDEEKDILAPVIADFKDKGELVFGPFSADGFFGSGDYKNYDGILAMYHDQGLIPFKSLSFGNGVNYTAGLPIIRTSPDHGTGYDIAGKNLATATSFRNAIFLACDIAKNRREQVI
jgi:4-hydroxythreonine-4-phosphate dehydrogenase